MNTSYTLAADALVAHVQINGVALPLATSFTVTGAEDAPLLVVLGGISAHRHAADSSSARGWWREQVGPGLALDTERWRILALDWIGGPEAPLPAEATHIVPGPLLQARAVAAALDRLQVRGAEALVGASFGGQVALAFGAHWPERVGRIITLCAAAQSSARARAFRHLQREALALGRASGAPGAGVALARALALLTYRTAADLEQRFGFDASAHAASLACSHEPANVLSQGTSGAPRSPDIEAWLAHHGRRFAARFDSATSEALLHGLDEPALDVAALTKLAVPLTAFAVREDELVPVDAVRALTATAPRGALHLHSSIHGHDAFLKDTEAVRAFLAVALGEKEVPS